MNDRKKKKLCNHNYKDLNTSLELLKQRTMIFPPKKEYICSVCHNFFYFNKE